MQSIESSSRITVPSNRPNQPVVNPLTGGLTILGLLGCARRRWKQAVALGGVCGVAAAILVWFYLPPAKPYAVTKLYFPTRPAGTVDHPDPPVNQQTQKELILSRLVMATVVEDPAIASLPIVTEKGDPISWLVRELAIEFPRESEIMRMTLTDERPEQAKAVLDKLAQVYTSRLSREAYDSRNVHVTRLREMVKQTEADYQREIDESSNSKTGGTASSNPEVAARRQSLLESEILAGRADIRKITDLITPLKTEEEAIDRRLQKKPLELTPGEFEPLFALNPEAVRLKQTKEELQTEYELKLAGLDEKNPTMIAIKNRIDQYEKRIETLRTRLQSTIALSVQEKLTEDRRKKRDEIARLENEKRAKEAFVADRETEADKLRVGTNNAVKFRPGLSATAARLQDLQARLQKMEAERDAPVGARTVDGEALIVRPNDAGRRMKMSGMAGVAAFGFIVAVLGFLELRSFRVATPSDVSQTLGLAIVGTVPQAPKGLKIGMGDAEWESILNEAVDSARTMFLHSAAVKNLRRVMVSSAVGGEGKTSLAARLAASLARSGRKTLLIDADLRNPSVHSQFNLPQGPGTAEVVRGESTLSACLQPSGREGLSVVTAGDGDRRAVEAIAQGAFGSLLAHADDLGFDFVLIDACPILPVADALIVAREVDGVLLSVLVDVSQVDRVNAACQKLSAIDVPLLGAVVNGARGNAHAYGPQYVGAN